MTQGLFTELEIEPDAPRDAPSGAWEAENDPGNVLAAEVVDAPEGGQMALARILPDGFDLVSLLAFLPDIRLKNAVTAAATALTGADVTGRDGLAKADVLREDVRSKVQHVVKLFDGTEAEPGPTMLANQLHKRLTGLRADFVKDGLDAIAAADKRIVAETRRLDAEDARVAAEAQAKADADAKAAALKAAEQAKAQHAPAPIVAALEQRAQTATAPPVRSTGFGGGGLKKSSVVDKWKARPVGTSDDADPNPVMADMSTAQLAQVIVLMKAVIDGKAPMTCFEVNWTKLNARADAEKSTLAIPGIEAVNLGSVRAKGKR